MANLQEGKAIVTVTAIDRALQVMEVLYEKGRAMGVNEIAREIGEYQSTVYRAISTLEARGYVHQNPETNKYSLGLKLYLMGQSITQYETMLSIVKPIADALSEEFNETVNISVRDNSRKDGYYSVTIYHAKSRNRALSLSEIVGQTSECNCSSVGKALAAFSEDLSLDKLSQTKMIPYTPRTIIDPAKVMDELMLVRSRGYAIDDEEQEKGLFCVGCPVLNAKGYAVMAMSVSGFVDNMHSIGVDNIVARLKVLCEKISRNIT